MLALGIIGREVGDNWETWRQHLRYADYVIVALAVAGVVYLILRRRGAWERTSQP